MQAAVWKKSGWILVLLGFSAPLFAQEIPLRITGVTADLQKGPGTPVYQVSASNMRVQNRSRMNWFRIQAVYETLPEYIDELEVEFYAATRPRELKKTETPPDYYKTRLFNLTIPYIDIAAGSHICEAYIHPKIIERYSDGKNLQWAVVFKYKGQPVAFESSLGERGRDWWNQIDALPMEGLMLDRTQTPFTFVNFEEYEVIRPQGNK